MSPGVGFTPKPVNSIFAFAQAACGEALFAVGKSGECLQKELKTPLIEMKITYCLNRL